MATIEELAPRFLALFEGDLNSHGTYRPPEKDPQVGSKLEIKTSARTLRDPPTLELWQEHLEGKKPLGVAPLRGDDTCLWGCIDIDKYDLVLAKLAAKVATLGVPMHLGRSKSGGAHIFVFLEKPASAISLQRWLRDVAARLGYAQSEIFPKQSTLLRERGDLPNWMIMPYFGETMPVLRSGGGEYTPEEFLNAAEKGRLPNGMLNLPVAVESGEIDLSDGPPCLQHLVAVGFAEGTRNNGLLALGVYAKKKWPEEWEAKFEEMNHTIMNSAGSAEQIIQMKRSLRKKDYNYRCRDIPLVNHCNSTLCRLRPHGVGDHDQRPTISSLSVLDTEPPVWFVDVGEERLELSTEELTEYKRFHKVCVERLLKAYPMMSINDWNAELSRALATVIKLESPPDVLRGGVFREELEEFLYNRQRGRRREDLHSGRPWEDTVEQKHYFRLRDLQERLGRNPNIKGLTRGQIATRIRDLGGGHSFFNIGGKGVNCHWVPSKIFEGAPIYESPKIEKDPM
jgi:hypothetical protein